MEPKSTLNRTPITTFELVDYTSQQTILLSYIIFVLNLVDPSSMNGSKLAYYQIHHAIISFTALNNSEKYLNVYKTMNMACTNASFNNRESSNRSGNYANLSTPISDLIRYQNNDYDNEFVNLINNMFMLWLNLAVIAQTTSLAIFY
ncbi:hypothetical protein BLOT_007590 [Blomia tropicalis]|nr:hypothetical protein BLOT_007590 [Blomia tropicalis]